VTFGPVEELAPTCSPDSQWIAFEYFHSRPDERGPQIWILPADDDSSPPKPLVANGGYHAGISWSPDSKWISFVEARLLRKGDVFLTAQVYKIRIDTREIIQVTQFPEKTSLGDDTAWSSTGEIAFQRDGDIYAVSANGGEPRKLFDLVSQNIQIIPVANMTWSPDGEQLAFLAWRTEGGEESGGIWIEDIRTQELRQITKGEAVCCPFWVNNSTLLHARGKGDGSSRIYSMLIETGKIEQLTRGPMDDLPCLDSVRGVLFFNHGNNADIKRGSWNSRLHIWKKKLPREVLLRLLPAPR
jgi:Tol biopolymer transport system component